MRSIHHPEHRIRVWREGGREEGSAGSGPGTQEKDQRTKPKQKRETNISGEEEAVLFSDDTLQQLMPKERLT
ncbi:hypothetical protein KFK09_021940 [Dendrobium nobile]|uniref:Uncharacterized protein n=1 Tax=Dendrobium nobile TaxID=94219 RepID=A0A8T3AH44_DENNO|nr:hypothetical protein KFK09_021940 [Dendrobium nobile]